MTDQSPESPDPERPLWPEAQRLHRIDTTIAITRFDDMEALHGDLVAYLIEMEQTLRTPSARNSYAAGGTKIHHVDSWPVPAARLLDARAQAFYRRIVGHATSAVDLSWANVYRAGHWIMPHAHDRSTGSVVYMLALGDEDEEDRMSGKFAFADSRLPLCCGAPTSHVFMVYTPPLKPGSMIVFPSNVVHLVTPYRGQKTARITMSWNINAAPIGGREEESVRRGIPLHPDRGHPDPN